jgi:hypothetical protein
MIRDVLSEIRTGATSVDDAEKLYNLIMDSDESSTVAEQLGLSRVEWTAFCQGVGFAELAQWRASGWPTNCAVCGKPIVSADFGWLAQAMDEVDHCLVHVSCAR